MGKADDTIFFAPCIHSYPKTKKYIQKSSAMQGSLMYEQHLLNPPLIVFILAFDLFGTMW